VSKKLVLHCLQEFPEQPGGFRLEGGGGAKADLDWSRGAGEVAVELPDEGRNLPGGGVGQVRVAAEVVGDDLGGVLGAEPGGLEELLWRQAEPGDDPAEVGQVWQVARSHGPAARATS